MSLVLFEKLKDKSCNKQNRKSGEMANRVFEKYKNSTMPHGKHIFKTAYDMAMSKMFTCP